MKLFTIGFTRTSAEHFFTRLKQAGVRKLVDVRLNRTSQLAGFAKADELAYFARAICGIETEPMPELAPTLEMLQAYRAARAAGAATAWADYARAFRFRPPKRSRNFPHIAASALIAGSSAYRATIVKNVSGTQSDFRCGGRAAPSPRLQAATRSAMRRR
jgi:hypothetical protein